MRTTVKVLCGTSLALGALLTYHALAQSAPARALPTRIIDGRAYVAVRDLQNIIRAEYHPASKTVTVQRPSPFLGAGGEAPFGSGTPYDYASLGGVMAVRQQLNTLQQQSLTNPARILLRYEIIASGYADVPSALQQGFPTNFRPPFAVTALLYWAKPGSTSKTSFERENTPQFGTQVRLSGPRFQDAQVEAWRYVTAPQNVQQTPTTVTFGPQAWEVLRQEQIPLPDGLATRLPAAIYDPSLQQVNAAQVRQGVAYPTLK